MNYSKRKIEEKIDELESTGSKTKSSAKANIAIITICAFVVLFITGFSLLLGVYNGIVDGTPDVSEVNIMPLGNATFIYDTEGNQLQKLNSSDGNRISVAIDQIPINMQHAIVAIEDSRFYEHNGVDTMGMVRAGAVALSTGFSRTEGASTITQQLLKNNVFTNWTNESKLERIKRKIQEQHLAIELESALKANGVDAKSIILENYLNTVNLGAGTYGVEAASLKYFGKHAQELSLSECAVLAAIPQNPSKFNPINHPDKNSERRAIVLEYMLKQQYISKSEYDEAIADRVYDRISAHEQDNANENAPYSYFVDELITNIQQDLMDRLGYTKIQAQKALYSGGLKIYSTMDSNVQGIMEEEFTNEANFPADSYYALEWALTVDHEDGERENYSREMLQKYFRENVDGNFDLLFNSEEEAKNAVDTYKQAVLKNTDTIVAERFSTSLEPQAAMAILDQKNGYVKGIVGGRGEKTASLVLNRATDSYRQPGSTFKILSTYGPAIETNDVNLSTVIKDEPYSYVDGTPLHNADGIFRGNVTVRTAIVNSINVIAVKVLTEITPKVGFSFLEKLGFSELINDEAYDVRQPLALGGITNGVSTLELAGAYGAIANKGSFNKPIFYTKVEDMDGNVLLENKEDPTYVFSDATCFLLTSAMRDVVTNNWAGQYGIDSQPLAGKTGTTTSYKDLVFAGFTPYYTAAIWAGYDLNTELPENQRDYMRNLWHVIMTRIHENLPRKEFDESKDVDSVTICSESGLLAGFGCPTTTEYFKRGTAPTVRCTKHIPTPTPTPTPSVTPTATPTPAQGITPTIKPGEDTADNPQP